MTDDTAGPCALLFYYVQQYIYRAQKIRELGMSQEKNIRIYHYTDYCTNGLLRCNQKAREQEVMRMRKKILDFVAALCFCFDVDWDKDFEDDEYCLERKRPVKDKKKITIVRDIPRAG